MLKRILCLTLICCMLLTLAPVAAVAFNSQEAAGFTVDFDLWLLTEDGVRGTAHLPEVYIRVYRDGLRTATLRPERFPDTDIYIRPRFRGTEPGTYIFAAPQMLHFTTLSSLYYVVVFDGTNITSVLVRDSFDSDRRDLSPYALPSNSLLLGPVIIEEIEPTPPPDLPFTDVHPQYHWYYSYVRFVYERNIMQGMPNNAFEPYSNLNRSQIIAMLFRLHYGRRAREGDPTSGHSFVDIPQNQWYAPYVQWAYTHALVRGDRFGPYDAIERQEFALVIHRYVTALTNLDHSSVSDARWEALADRGLISGAEAYNALRWANNNGIVQGTPYPYHEILPGRILNRSQAAAMFMRLANLLP